MPARSVPTRYVPSTLSAADRRRQEQMLMQSSADYKAKKYTVRAKLASFKSKPSGHVARAREMYGVDTVAPGRAFAKATGCTVSALKAIVNKGAGAYYSSGSRPNQTAQSWGLARLASAVTGGKAAAVDFSILEDGCGAGSRALALARTAKAKHGHGQGATRKTRISAGGTRRRQRALYTKQCV